MSRLSEALVRKGHQVTYITTCKKLNKSTDSLSPSLPYKLYEINSLGAHKPSQYNTKGSFASISTKSFTGILKKIGMKLGGQIPDPRLLWSFSLALNCIPKEVRTDIRDCDIILASSPPWPSLLAGYFLSKIYNKHFVCDWRDPLYQCHEMPTNPIAAHVEKVFERFFSRHASLVATVSEPLLHRYQRYNQKSVCIFNGFSEEKINSIVRTKAPPEKSLSPIVVRYFGMVSPGRIPYPLLESVAYLYERKLISPEYIVIDFYGESSILQSYIRNYFPAISVFFRFMEWVSHDKALSLMSNSDILLFSETSLTSTDSQRGILTTKLFEYIGYQIPILATIDPETEAGRLISIYGHSNSIATNQSQLISQYLLDFKNNSSLQDSIRSSSYRNLSSEYQTSLYIDSLLKICS